MVVLIVASNPDLSRIWARHLERLGADVIVAESGHAAVDLIEARNFDVICLDLVLEKGSALTVADVGFGNLLDGLQFNTTTTAIAGEATVTFPLAGIAEPLAAFRACAPSRPVS